MQQHPVPQHISSYEFKLVGDMTLKQFFQLAGGLVISLIFYATPLPGFIKWPLVLLFGLVGAALAFLPIEERPLSQWALAFVKAIYSPTLYTWSGTGAEDVFAKGMAADSGPSAPNLQVGQTEEVQRFEQGEKNFFSKVTAMFAGLPHAANTAIAFNQQAQTAGMQENQGVSFTQGTVLSQDSDTAKPVQPNTPSGSGQIRVEMAMSVPTSAPVKVEVIPVQVQTPAQPQNSQSPLTPVFSSSRPSDSGQAGQATQATFTPEAAPPAPPERPNTIVGQVLTSEGKIVEGAILEIRDSTTKTPLRALRSNRVGHFITVTPVQDGIYEIVTEKEGFTFEIVQFKAEGRLIPPIQIKAQG